MAKGRGAASLRAMQVIKVCLLWCALGLAVLPAWSADTAPSYKNVQVDEFERLVKAGSAVVLDVRTAKEYAGGHLSGATNIDFLARDFAKALVTLDTNKTYLVYCASGRRSVGASQEMSRRNFTKLYNLEGGFRAWEKAGKTVAK